MSPVDYALNEIKRVIPKQLLEACFIETRAFGEHYNKMPVSIDYKIRVDVLESRVLVDTDLVGGQDTHISLNEITPEYLPTNKTIWRIPLELTDNKLIVSVDSIIYSTRNHIVPSYATAFNPSTMVEKAQGLMSTAGSIPLVGDEQIRLVGENVVMADTIYPYGPNLVLKCTLQNDAELNNLPRRSYPKFSKLVTLAVKSHIYNELYVMSSGVNIVAGVDLGNFSSVLDNYADAEEMYQEYLTTTWAKVAILSDVESKRRHLEQLISRQ